MPSRPEDGSASHGLDSAVPQPRPVRQFTESEIDAATARYSAFLNAVITHGVDYMEDMQAHLDSVVTQTRREIRRRERSLDKLNRRIISMSKSKKSKK